MELLYNCKIRCVKIYSIYHTLLSLSRIFECLTRRFCTLRNSPSRSATGNLRTCAARSSAHYSPSSCSSSHAACGIEVKLMLTSDNFENNFFNFNKTGSGAVCNNGYIYSPTPDNFDVRKSSCRKAPASLPVPMGTSPARDSASPPTTIEEHSTLQTLDSRAHSIIKISNKP